MMISSIRLGVRCRMSDARQRLRSSGRSRVATTTDALMKGDSAGGRSIGGLLSNTSKSALARTPRPAMLTVPGIASLYQPARAAASRTSAALIGSPSVGTSTKPSGSPR